ncbi:MULTISPECIES: TadE/TadG family type IV pilus assembly protein [Paraburkholderia]|uniref:Pilus assembly protein n=1 Tax=Paraburkholderia podalyriae TaxID=1938811 RepID=A0ABR7PKP7_9BURK|nr:TadE/TadG family type IV pilus assembly protein [Paraburkholderia podalyriae]MBC8746945.1 pilus assembly protein [Paraburkholderia podalyriae]
MKRRPVSPKRMRGVAAVEFALVLIPLVLLVAGVSEFGRAIYQYEALTKSTRNAARYLSEYLPSDTSYPTYKSEALCLAVYGNTGCTGSSLVPGLTTSLVVVCDSASPCTGPSDPSQFANVATYDSNNGVNSGTPVGTINLVEVKITGFPYAPLLPVFNPTATTFNDILTVMRQVS